MNSSAWFTGDDGPALPARAIDSDQANHATLMQGAERERSRDLAATFARTLTDAGYPNASLALITATREAKTIGDVRAAVKRVCPQDALRALVADVYEALDERPANDDSVHIASGMVKGCDRPDGSKITFDPHLVTCTECAKAWAERPGQTVVVPSPKPAAWTDVGPFGDLPAVRVVGGDYSTEPLPEMAVTAGASEVDAPRPRAQHACATRYACLDCGSMAPTADSAPSQSEVARLTERCEVLDATIRNQAAAIRERCSEIVEWRVRAETAEGKAAEAFGEVKAGLAREDDLRRSLATVKTDVDGVWLWQGDGYDHPKSLSCSVVMSADTLRSLVARAEKAERERDAAWEDRGAAEKAEERAEERCAAAVGRADSLAATAVRQDQLLAREQEIADLRDENNSLRQDCERLTTERITVTQEVDYWKREFSSEVGVAAALRIAASAERLASNHEMTQVKLALGVRVGQPVLSRIDEVYDASIQQREDWRELSECWKQAAHSLAAESDAHAARADKWRTIAGYRRRDLDALSEQLQRIGAEFVSVDDVFTGKPLDAVRAVTDAVCAWVSAENHYRFVSDMPDSGGAGMEAFDRLTKARKALLAFGAK